MARPRKTGLDYFPVDVDLQRDMKLRKPKQRYGSVAVEVYLALLCMIYRDKGYYLDYRDPEDVAFTAREYLDGKYQPTPDLVKDIIELLIACELFSGDYARSKNILTSRRVQETYYSATVDRTECKIDLNYWMLTLEEMAELSKRHSLYKNLVFRSKNGVNPPKKYTKQSKEYLEEEEENARATFDLCGHYEFLFSTELTNGQKFELNSLIKDYGESEVLEVMEDMRDRNIKHPLRYLRKVLVDHEKRQEAEEIDE